MVAWRDLAHFGGVQDAREKKTGAESVLRRNRRFCRSSCLYIGEINPGDETFIIYFIRLEQCHLNKTLT